MTLGSHLIELRNRLFKVAIAVVLMMIVGFIFSEAIIEEMSKPIYAIAESRNAILNFDTVTGGFDLRLKVALTVGFVLSSPIWLYQIWAFLVPGLTKREIRYAVGFLGVAIPLFFAGAYAGWWIMPRIVEVMASFTPQGAANFFQAAFYYDFVLKLVLAVGIAFILPVFLVLLNFVGVLSAEAIIKGWRWAILLIMLFCAMATPSVDIISMFLLAVPMLLLYFAAWFVSWINDRRRARKARKLEEEFAS